LGVYFTTINGVLFRENKWSSCWFSLVSFSSYYCERTNEWSNRWCKRRRKIRSLDVLIDTY